jgi:hypothetical protein
MALWVELQSRFSFDYKNLGDDLIGRFYKYAKWCLGSPAQNGYLSDAGTAASVTFFEHLPGEKFIRDDIYKWLSKEEFLKLESVFRYHLESKEYEEFKESFMEKRTNFLQETPKIKNNFFASLRLKLNVKLKQHHVAVLHDVFFAFHAVEAFFTRGGHGTTIH